MLGIMFEVRLLFTSFKVCTFFARKPLRPVCRGGGGGGMKIVALSDELTNRFCCFVMLKVLSISEETVFPDYFGII